jgi:peptidoglycan hydrolase-like amidase/putative cell wall-binding protein
VRRLSLVLLAIAALTAGILPLASPAAAQQSCPAPGGAGLPAHSNVPSGEVQVLGRGWGHGVGMSQYGARGAARLGCSAEQILTTYYPGTQVTAKADTAIAVSLWPDRPNGPGVDFLDVYAETADVQWQVRGPGGGPDDWLDFTTTQPRGVVWRAVILDLGGEERYVVQDMSRGGELVHIGGRHDTIRIPLQNRHLVQLPQKSTSDHWRDGRPYRRGVMSMQPRGGTDRQLNVRVDLPSVEQYLYGLSEVPSSWEAAALQAQAIAGRSYAQRNSGRPLFDSPSDQVYSGLLKEAEPQFGQRWVDAVNATNGRVVTYQGEIAQTYYSSSHGGQSESNRFSAFFGADAVIPYLRPVDDTRWEAAADSPVRTWAHSFSRNHVAGVFGFTRLDSIRTPEVRGAGGRVGVPGRRVYSDTSRTYGGVELTGVREGRIVTERISGLQFVQRLNVTRRSELFEVRIVEDACSPATDQSQNTVVTRNAGSGRIETSVAASRAHWETSSEAVLATADDFADALSAAALAARRDAPLLLTSGQRLASAVREELERLEVDTVHLMGGRAAVSDAVEVQLTADGYTVERVAGDTRFSTATAAALKAGASASGDVALALGENWPDAVSAGGLAASVDRVPTLLSLRSEVPAATIDALEQLEAERVLLIGGTAALSGAVADQLRAEGFTVERLSGDTRFATSVAVAEDAVERGGESPRPVVLASGATFPDALTAGAVTARLGGALVLVPRCDLVVVPGTTAFLADGGFDTGVIIGGVAAVSDRVREQTTDAIDG